MGACEKEIQNKNHCKRREFLSKQLGAINSSITKKYLFGSLRKRNHAKPIQKSYPKPSKPNTQIHLKIMKNVVQNICCAAHDMVVMSGTISMFDISGMFVICGMFVLDHVRQTCSYFVMSGMFDMLHDAFAGALAHDGLESKTDRRTVSR